MTSATNTVLPNAKRASKMPSSNQSLNHLLNFSLPPRQTQPNFSRRSNRKTNASLGVRNTERFVNAQYRFIMRPSGDYTVHFADPDIFFQWQDVLQVIIPRTSAVAAAGSHRNDEGLTTCPICLSPPTAPRMTRCGHVFCYPCILHYLNTSDVQKWIRCPICFDSVTEEQLKSVKWFRPDAGDVNAQLTDEYELDLSSSSKTRRTLRMRLMERPQITTLALPRSSTWPSDLVVPHEAPFHFLPDVFVFSKFMLATPQYLLAELDRDLKELRVERKGLESMKDDLGILFVDAAERKVHAEIESARTMDTELLQRTVAKAHKDLAEIQRREARKKELAMRDAEAPRPQDIAPAELLSLNPIHHQVAAPRDTISKPSRSRRNLNPPPPSTSTYFYYQSASGSPIFLHPLDIRILLSRFHTHASFPNEISVEVETFSEGSVNEDLRKRCRYLALPEGADVVFVETDLGPVVGTETLKSFEGALKTRRAKRRERVRKDDRAKLRAEEKEREKAYGAMSEWGVVGGEFSSTVRIQDDWSSARPQEAVAEAEGAEGAQEGAQQQQVAGAWGSRSFASALHASPSARGGPPRNRRQEEPRDEWDIDMAWHEMQRGGGGGGRRQGRGRSQRMVVLGGGAGGARRR